MRRQHASLTARRDRVELIVCFLMRGLRITATVSTLPSMPAGKRKARLIMRNSRYPLKRSRVAGCSMKMEKKFTCHRTGCAVALNGGAAVTLDDVMVEVARLSSVVMIGSSEAEVKGAMV